ncbi:AMP-dependent synthetase/ligase [Kiloniella laminariae]|uniref:AMP-dependent synthetase/ligase n=1 Tax=Kiloniella laminariae TaxID=454162 RepID=UPI0005242286|nr:long-chain fatty acid--CoA ligase [Kiloniella laminariae]
MPKAKNLVSLFYEQAKERGELPFLWFKENKVYTSVSWSETARRVSALAHSLKTLGLEKGERVVLVSENRPEWFIADLAIMAAGGITVPAYTTNNTLDHQYVLGHSGATGIIVSTSSLAQKAIPAAIDASECRWAIGMERFGQGQESALPIHSWDKLISEGEQEKGTTPDIADELSRTDLACIIYTSGTGGAPKGVMLSHGAILCNCEGAWDVLEDLGLGEETFLSFLPLSHAYEHSAGQFFPLLLGAQIYYGEGAEHLLRNLAEVKPTIMTAVPRLYETMHIRITRGLEKEKPLKQKLFYKAEALGRKKYHSGGSLSPLERILDSLLEKLVRNKLRQRFGGRLKAMVSGGAALNEDIGLFFHALGLPVLQGYGQTEAAPVIAVNRPGKIDMATVGSPLKGVEVKLGEENEILVSGELLMSGYWKDPRNTAATIKEGWLHTGDIGEFDSEGRLKITDRKKDIIVLSGGDNISPARIESLLTLHSAINQAMVYGNKRAHLVAIIVPDEEFLDRWGEANKIPGVLASVYDNASLKISIAKAIDQINRQLSPLEKIRKFIIAREAFTIDNTMMTPTLKIRRHKIIESYAEEIEGLYRKSL